MSGITRFFDGLANVLTGSGTSVDRRVQSTWATRLMDQVEIDNAYRASWLMRKVIDLPAHDMTRAWRAWQADKDAIEAIEKEERRLKVREKIQAGLVLGRLGGGIVIMGVNAGLPDEPLDLERVGQGSLRFLYPVSRHSLTLGPVTEDLNDDEFGEPEYFELSLKSGSKVKIHRSRVLVFKGVPAGQTGIAPGLKGGDYWGDSIVSIVNDAVMNATDAQDEIAGLIKEAKIDVFGIPELLNMMGDPVREKQIMRRLELANVGKSNHRALVKDAAETWEQRQITWGGMPEIIRTFVSLVAGASDIPATRLMGKSPDGMNATGEGDERNYHEMIESGQSNHVRPALEKLDEVLLRSTFGKRDPSIYFEFNKLRVTSEKDEADIEAKEAESITKIANVGLLPEEALAQAVANRLVESGRYPGLESALEAMGEWWKVTPEGPQDDLEGTGEGNDDTPGTGGPGGIPEGSTGASGATG